MGVVGGNNGNGVNMGANVVAASGETGSANLLAENTNSGGKNDDGVDVKPNESTTNNTSTQPKDGVNGKTDKKAAKEPAPQPVASSNKQDKGGRVKSAANGKKSDAGEDAALASGNNRSLYPFRQQTSRLQPGYVGQYKYSPSVIATAEEEESEDVSKVEIRGWELNEGHVANVCLALRASSNITTLRWVFCYLSYDFKISQS